MPTFLLSLILLLIPMGIRLPFIQRDKVSDYEQTHTTWTYPPWEHTWGIVRATESHLNLLTFGRATFRNPQGLDVVRLDATNDPDKRGDDDEVTVYGINSGENAIIYNRSMKRLGLFGYDNDTRDVLNAPWDVAALPDGQVFVTDAGNRRVVKLRNVKGDLRVERSFGDDGDLALTLPRGIEATRSGKVIVADAGSDRIVVYDTSGTVQYAIGGLKAPVGLAAVDGEADKIYAKRWARSDTSFIVVTDSGGVRLTKLGFDGTLFSQQVIHEPGMAWQPYLGHVEIDYYHNVIASDSANHRLLKFSPTLERLSAWGQRGTGRGYFEGPTGVAMWRSFGQTFVANADGAHYLWVASDLADEPRVALLNSRIVTIDTRLTESSDIDMRLVNADGDTVRSRRGRENAGDCHIRWNLERTHFIRFTRDGDKTVTEKEPLEAGEYELILILRPTYSSRKAFSKEVVLPLSLPEQPVKPARSSDS